MRRNNTRVTVNNRRGPGLMGTMAQTAVIAGTATVVSKKTSQAMGGSAQAKQTQQQAQQMQQQAQVQSMVEQQVAEQMAQQQAIAEQQALQQQLAEQQAQLQQLLAQQQPAPQPAAPVAPAAGADAMAIRITKLKELAELRDAGILTEAEFETEKARILAG